MNNNGPRPLGIRKTVQLMVILTILAWATQTLLSQWGYGAVQGAPTTRESASFVPAAGGRANAAVATLEVRGEATVIGGDVKLKQICRWSKKDAAFFTPIADLVIARLGTDSPYRTLSVAEIKELLHDAGVSLSTINFAGATTCTVDRGDVKVDETQALQKWIAAREAPSTQPAPAADPDVKPQPVAAPLITEAAPAAPEAQEQPLASDGPFHTLRDILTEDLSQRLTLDPKQLQISFNARDEKTLGLAQPHFRFQVIPQRARNLGPVMWQVEIITDTGTQRVEISALAKAWQEQLIIARPLSAKQLIRAEDVTQRRALVDRVDDKPLPTVSQVVGNQAARDLKSGTIVTANMVEPVPLARPGQFVTVTLTTANVKVKTVARALEAGSYGQTIRVKNEATKEIYEVVLTGPQTAEMNGGAVGRERDAKVASATE